MNRSNSNNAPKNHSAPAPLTVQQKIDILKEFDELTSQQVVLTKRKLELLYKLQQG